MTIINVFVFLWSTIYVTQLFCVNHLTLIPVAGVSTVDHPLNQRYSLTSATAS